MPATHRQRTLSEHTRKAILTYAERVFAADGIPPTRKDVAAALRIADSTADRHVNELIAAGKWPGQVLSRSASPAFMREMRRVQALVHHALVEKGLRS